jgi:heterodisulfide reductase subunit A
LALNCQEVFGVKAKVILLRMGNAMEFFVNDEVFVAASHEPVIHVDRDRCDGCGMCIDTCPTNALEIVPNKNRPGRKIVFVHPKLCKGCGVCQATCPKEALFLPGLSPENLRTYISKAVDAASVAVEG